MIARESEPTGKLDIFFKEGIAVQLKVSSGTHLLDTTSIVYALQDNKSLAILNGDESPRRISVEPARYRELTPYGIPIGSILGASRATVKREARRLSIPIAYH